jgi:hypothetical protein
MTAILAAGTLLSPVPALAGGPRPDIMVAKKKSGPYFWDGVYEIDNGAIQQKVERVIKPGAKRSFFIKVQNDLDSGTVTLKSRSGCFAGSLCVRWFQGPGEDDVTGQVNETSGYAFALGAGETERFRVQVRVKRHPSLDRYGLHATTSASQGTDTANMRTTVG